MKTADPSMFYSFDISDDKIVEIARTNLLTPRIFGPAEDHATFVRKKVAKDRANIKKARKQKAN